MRATVADAWSLAPIGELRLGEKVFPVPPLTFARFQRLIGAEPQAFVSALVDKVPTKTAAERLMARALRWTILYAPRLTRYLWKLVDLFGLGKQNGRVPELAGLVRICVPDVPEELWKTHGAPIDAVNLFLTFGRGHDWSLISDAIRLGEPLEPGETMPSQADFVGGLLAVAKATGYKVEELTEMRVDGFYLLVEALREQRPPEVGGEIPMGVEYENQEGSSALLDMLKRAEEAGRGSE